MKKENLKDAGVDIGHAFKDFGKTFIRSAKTTVEKVDDKINSDSSDPKQEPESTVYSDGSWRKTGKGIGSAFKNFGSALIGSDDKKNPEE